MAAVQKTNKKRSATTQHGPKPKKSHTEKVGSSDKRRSRPVTLPARDDPNSSDSEGITDIEGQDEVWVGSNEHHSGDMPQVLSENAVHIVPKDPNASRESHKVQKALQDQRRAAKPHSNLLSDAKRVWSLLRQKNISTAERQKHVQDLMEVIRGNVKDIVFKHDASRIVQSVVKYGGQKEREEIATELKGRYKDLAQNKYSKFLITKLIRMCPSHRASILMEFQSNVLRLLLHREATSVLADAFELYANAYERTILLRDFYGKEAILFNFSEDKETAKKGLSGILEGGNDDRKRRTMTAVKENLIAIFNNSDKGAVTHAVVHRVLWEYLSALKDISNEAEREKLRRELFDSQEVLAEMVHTKDGSRVVREFLAHGTAKDRKQILKVLKPHIERMCIDDEAQLVIFTALDVIDDTKLMSKSLISEITGSANKLCASPQGRRSILYLLLPRNRRHFTPAQISSLAEIDPIRAGTSKKDPDARVSEIRTFASEALLAWISSQGSSIIREPGGSLVAADIMLYAEGDKSQAINTLLEALSSPYPSVDLSSPHLVDLPHTSRFYKTLLQGGHFNHGTKTIDRAENWNTSQFALSIMGAIDKEVIVGMCTKGDRNGAFIVIELCEALSKEPVDKERQEARSILKGWFDLGVKRDIEFGEARGKKLLLEKLALL